MKIIWRMIPETRSATDRIFGHFGLFFVLYPLPPPPTRSPSLTTQIIKTLKKSKKHLQISFGYLQICADMVRDGCNCYFSFWAILFLFTPLTAQKNEKFKKMKNRSWDIIIVPKIIIICYTVPEIWGVTFLIDFFHFWLFFALKPPPPPPSPSPPLLP